MKTQRQGGVFDPGAFDCGGGSGPEPLLTPSPYSHMHASSNRTQPPSEEDPLQNPRPPEQRYHRTSYDKGVPSNVQHRNYDQNFVYRAKRWSARLSGRASVLWASSGGGSGGGGGDMACPPPPPVPRHRDTSKYNQNHTDTNHIRLFERKTRAYTCRELLCIVFLPCLLICLLGIALSSLVIYYQIGKEYEGEIEMLESELSLARERDGVYLSSHKYRDLIRVANTKQLEQDDQKDALEDLQTRLAAQSRLVEDKSRAVDELNGKIESLRATLDCTYTVVQTERDSVAERLETECKLSHRAQLLLAASDQAAAGDGEESGQLFSSNNRLSFDTPKKKETGHSSGGRQFLSESSDMLHHGHHAHSKGSANHWLLGSKRSEQSESSKFEEFLVTELTRMEQNIVEFSSHHQTFCSEFRLNLEAEVERRSQDMGVLANRLAGLVDNQAKAIGRLETLAADQMYAEQKWVTSYLKNIRNEADRQSSSLQGYLTESFLPSIRILNSGVLELSTQVSSLQSTVVKTMQAGTNKLNAFLDRQQKQILSTKDIILNLSKQQNNDIQVLAERQEEMLKAEATFEVRFKEAQRKIEGLLTSVMAEYQLYSNALNKTSTRTSATLDSMAARSQEIDSTLNIAVSKVVSSGDELKSVEAMERLKLDSEISGNSENTEAAIKTLGTELRKVELQGKQMVGERQGAWELHYSNSELMLRKKADTNKELLQKHQVQTQETHSSLLQFSNELEKMTEKSRQKDNTHTTERQADLQAACKNVAGFSHLLSSELHARDSDLANYFANTGRK